jgi:hypothetical protein
MALKPWPPTACNFEGATSMTTEATNADAVRTAEDQDAALDLGNDLVTGVAPARTEPAASASTDAGATEGDATEEGAKGGGHGIPRARLNEVNERRRLAEEQLAQRERENEELRAQLDAMKAGRQPEQAPAAAPRAASFDVDAAEEEYAQALLDGDTKAASAIRRTINQHIEDSALQRFEQTTQERTASTLAQGVVERALEQYPWLDEPEGAVALELIEASMKSKVAAGMARHEALASAVQTIAPRFAPNDPPGRVLPNGGAPVDTRLERANKRGAADSLLQPAAVQAGMGNRATPPQVDTTQLTDEQLMSLPKEDLQKALGY